VDPEDRWRAIEAHDLAAVGRVAEEGDAGRGDLLFFGKRPPAPVPDVDEAFIVGGGELLEPAWSPTRSRERAVGHDGPAQPPGGDVHEAERVPPTASEGLHVGDGLAVRRWERNQGEVGTWNRGEPGDEPPV